MASQRHTTRRSSTDRERFCKAEVRLLSLMKVFLTSKARPNHLINLNHCPTIDNIYFRTEGMYYLWSYYKGRIRESREGRLVAEIK